MRADEAELSERLNMIEVRLRRLEGSMARKSIMVIDANHLRSTKEAVDQFLASSEQLRSRWSGTLSSVDEVRTMRKKRRGY